MVKVDMQENSWKENAMAARQVIGVVGVSVLAFSIMMTFGCGGGGGSVPPLKVTGAAANNFPILGTSTLIVVSQSGTAVDNATVTITVNTGAPQSVAFSGTSGTYARIGSPTMNPGDNITIAVTHDGITATTTVAMPEQPAIVTPAGASTQNAALDIAVTWSAFSTTPDKIMGQILDGTKTVSGNPWTAIGIMVFSPPTQLTISAGTLKTGQTGISLDFDSSNVSIDLGSHSTTDSYFEADYFANSVTFNTQ